MKNLPITICDAVIHPGELANLAMPLPEQYSCSPMYMPIKVIHGKDKGPCIVVFSNIKGNELNGLEIINQIVDIINPSDIKGTLIAIPVLNVYGLTHFPRTLPSGGDLADCFPGAEDGSFGERLAYVFTQEILKKADYCIELQTGALNHNILPQVYCNFDNPIAKKLAKAFQSPVITNVALGGNMLRQTTEDIQVPLLVYQAGEAMRFDENSIKLGKEGILNVMREIGMLEGDTVVELNPMYSQDEDWIVAHKGGVLHADVRLGQMIQEGEVIGKITDPFGTYTAEYIKSNQNGIIVGINATPLVHEGLSIFKVASFIDYDKAESVIETWNEKQPDSYTD